VLICFHLWFLGLAHHLQRSQLGVGAEEFEDLFDVDFGGVGGEAGVSEDGA